MSNHAGTAMGIYVIPFCEGFCPAQGIGMVTKVEEVAIKFKTKLISVAYIQYDHTYPFYSCYAFAY
ncbi:hypothetical protein [Vibrio sp. F74]|uniref:hypothetical protein n=1 Tax=Vibrio sp. F74 TaxID=700020 RepID=UPI0035F5D04A